MVRRRRSGRGLCSNGFSEEAKPSASTWEGLLVPTGLTAAISDLHKVPIDIRSSHQPTSIIVEFVVVILKY